jgi:hypothetical protein
LSLCTRTAARENACRRSDTPNATKEQNVQNFENIAAALVAAKSTDTATFTDDRYYGVTIPREGDDTDTERRAHRATDKHAGFFLKLAKRCDLPAPMFIPERGIVTDRINGDGGNAARGIELVRDSATLSAARKDAIVTDVTNGAYTDHTKVKPEALAAFGHLYAVGLKDAAAWLDRQERDARLASDPRVHDDTSNATEYRAEEGAQSDYDGSDPSEVTNPAPQTTRRRRPAAGTEAT